MTKPWEVANAESHKLTNRAISGKDTKKILKRKHDRFFASSKPKQWEASAKNDELSTASESEPTPHTEEVHWPPPSNIGYEHVHLPLVLHSPPRPQTQTAPIHSAHHHQPLSSTNSQGDSRADPSDLSAIQATYDEFDRGSDIAATSIVESVNTSRFVDGAGCVRRQAAREDDANALRRIINTEMQSKSPNIDMKDATTNSTALEVAIRAGQIANVETLISAGASVNSENERGETPLHVAIMFRANWMICDLLLKHHADPNFRLDAPHCSIAPLTMAVHIDQKLGMVEAENQVQIVKLLLDCDAKYEPDWSESRRVYSNFLTLLNRSSFGVGRPSTPFLECLALFLRMGSDPWSLLPDAVCPAGHCHFFAQFVLFHAREASLPDVLLQNSNIDRYGQDLVTLLLDPCPHRTKPPNGPALSSLVQQVVDRGVVFDYTRNPISTALAKSPNKDKAALIRALLTASSLSIHTRDNHLGRPLEALAKVLELLRWDLAELILSRDLDLAVSVNPTRNFQHKVAQIFVFEPRSWYHRYADNGFKQVIASYLGVFQWEKQDVDTEEIRSAVRCVIHVLTKRILDDLGSDPTASSDQERSRDATMMRQKYDLPEISIRKDSLLESPGNSKQEAEPGMDQDEDEDTVNK